MPNPDEQPSASSNSASLRIRQVAVRVASYVEMYEGRRDQRAVFAFVYHRLTESLADYADTGAVPFHDQAWIADLTETFAGRFFHAMDSIDAWQEAGSNRDDLSEAVDEPWADVLISMNEGSYVLEDLVFSMMAHISYDLPKALLESGMDHAGVSHIADYHLMNAVLAGETEAVQRDVSDRYNRFLGLLDRFAGHYDEFFTSYGIRLSRSAAWYNAARLHDPLSAAEAQRSILRSTGAFIEFVRRPKVRWIRILVRVVRFITPRFRRWPETPGIRPS